MGRERFDCAQAAVGRRDAADGDDDPVRALGDRCGDELADAAARRVERVVSLRPAGEGEPTGLRRLDQRRAVLLEPPLGFDRLADGPVTVVRRLPPPSTSSVPSPPSASGSSTAVQPARAAPAAIAAAASRAVSVPRNLSGAASRRITPRLSLPYGLF